MQRAASLEEYIALRSRGCPSGCIEWKGPFTGGIPIYYLRRRHSDSKRLKGTVRRYILGIASRAQVVVVTCGNPLCIKESHLKAIPTGRPNIIQPRVKCDNSTRRSIFGSVLTDEARQQATRMLASGQLQKDVAAQLGVSQSTISRLQRRGDHHGNP